MRYRVKTGALSLRIRIGNFDPLTTVKVIGGMIELPDNAIGLQSHIDAGIIEPVEGDSTPKPKIATPKAPKLKRTARVPKPAKVPKVKKPRKATSLKEKVAKIAKVESASDTPQS